MRQSTESMLLDISCDSKREMQAVVKEASDQKTVVVRVGLILDSNLSRP